jgi:hypothetical protein
MEVPRGWRGTEAETAMVEHAPVIWNGARSLARGPLVATEI